MTETLQQMMVANLATIVMAIAGGIWAWARISNRSKANTHIAKEARDKAEAVEKDLAAFKLEAAKDYASNKLIETLGGKIMDEIHSLRDRVDRVLDRHPE